MQLVTRVDRSGRKGHVGGGIASAALLAFVLFGLQSWSLGPIGDLLLIVAALGPLIRLPHTIPVWAALILLVVVALSLTVGSQAFAEQAADLAYFGLAVGCFWGIWNTLAERLAWKMPMAWLTARLIAWAYKFVRGGPSRDALPAQAGPPRPTTRKSATREAAAGIAAGLMLAAGAWLGSGQLAKLLPTVAAVAVRTAVPAAAPALAPAAATLLPTPFPYTCDSGPTPNPYAVLTKHQPDVLRFYTKNGWDPLTQCQQIYDNWLGTGVYGGPPTTAEAFVTAKGWATMPDPAANCAGPPNVVAAAGADPYAILAHRLPNVLRVARDAGRDLATNCVAILDDWARRGADGNQPTTVLTYTRARGWVAIPAVTCAGPPALATRLGYDPYAVLAAHRQDVLLFYAKNGWDVQARCVNVFDDWLAHSPDGQPAMAAAQYVVAMGWQLTGTPVDAPTANPAS